MNEYPTIAAAEKAITDAGYIRDSQRHIWVNGAKTAKVVRTPKMPWENNLQFSVQWG